MANELKSFTFRRNDGSTFEVKATDAVQARVIAQSQHDQTYSDESREADADSERWTKLHGGEGW